MNYQQLKDEWFKEDLEYIESLRKDIKYFKTKHVKHIIQGNKEMAEALNLFINDLQTVLEQEESCLKEKK